MSSHFAEDIFDFDFFSSDQLVCTEVIFRAYDGLDRIQFNLIERAGRLSLSAEDLFDIAVKNKGFSVVAGYGFKGCENHIDCMRALKTVGGKLLINLPSTA